jgi:hypothetical protein
MLEQMVGLEAGRENAMKGMNFYITGKTYSGFLLAEPAWAQEGGGENGL